MESYNIDEMLDFGKTGVEKIKSYLESDDNIIVVEDVQYIREYQLKDIDLRYLTKTNMIIAIEVKTDRYYTTGNFFFETISNKQKNTPGCFMYTEANYIYYYYNTVNKIYKIPVHEARQWFIDRMDSFKTKETSTDNYYITIGKLVPRKIIMEHVDIEVINI